jgi:hypothetical protein
VESDPIGRAACATAQARVRHGLRGSPRTYRTSSCRRTPGPS